MDELYIENVRCFHLRQSAPLSPITVLVGENSTGKTTFLALARIAWDLAQGNVHVDFNEEPFQLGTYDEIANYRGGKAGRAKSFMVGTITNIQKRAEPIVPGDTIEFRCRIVGAGAQPRVDTWTLCCDPYKVEISYDESNNMWELVLTTPSCTIPLPDMPWLGFRTSPIVPYLAELLPMLLEGSFSGRKKRKIADLIPVNELTMLQSMLHEFYYALGPRPYAFAPIRSRPQRTYDPFKDVPRPEGSHVPMILAKTFFASPALGHQLRTALDAFGKSSGLFSDVEIHRLGRKQSDPFQVQVKVAGPAFNLVDVGYGVSQVLPIVVDSLSEPEGTTFLLQQPEVHLHPSAQAELGTFLALLATQGKKRFLIETHSDYLLDRIRMDVRDGHVQPTDVSVLYFERERSEINIRTLRLDTDGNLLDVPSSYRQFFLREEQRFLGI